MTTLIMGIVNVTPDSFSDGGRYLAADDAIAHGLRLRDEGAAYVDVGGESTRPGSERVPVAQELQRVLPVIRALASSGVAVSIDTMNAPTATAAVEAGAVLVNDVSGGMADPGMLDAVAATGADFAIGHWRGPSSDMYARAQYADIGREVAAELRERVEAAAAAGIPPSRVIVDPGIGFGKAGAQNWALLADLAAVTGLGYRVLIGTSRKRFLGDLLGREQGGEVAPERRDLATAVTSALAARAGVWGVRVHDVAASRDALAVEQAWREGASWTG